MNDLKKKVRMNWMHKQIYMHFSEKNNTYLYAFLSSGVRTVTHACINRKNI